MPFAPAADRPKPVVAFGSAFAHVRFAPVGAPPRLSEQLGLTLCQGREFAVGKAKANAKVAKSLFQKATGTGPSAVTAAIFWAKTQMGWRKQSPQDGQAREPDYSLLSDAELLTLLELLAKVEGDVTPEVDAEIESFRWLCLQPEEDMERPDAGPGEERGREQVDDSDAARRRA